jgi:SAM-dependent methyltransferase
MAAPNPRADIVSTQYSRWMYPEPIQDLSSWLAGNWQWFDPSHAQEIFWPDRAPRSDLDILVAGCGTNQAAVLAFTNPAARVVAIDVSQPSLDHHRFLVDKYAMRNLELHRLPIEEVGSLGRDFDLVVSTGVLHHLADPLVGARALAARLRPEGVLALMLYARYGRIGVEMMQAVFRDLGLQQNEASVLMVKEAIASLAQDHPLRSYIAIAPDLQYDAGLVDTFLHGRDRSYTVDDCLELVSGAGLVFQEWFLKSAYYPQPASGNALLAAVAELPDEKQWAVMERINARNGCHFFTACRPERPRDRYRIDFASPAATGYVPAFRYRCRLDGVEIVRPGWKQQLDPVSLALVQQVDGRRSIAEIIAAAASSGVLPPRSQAELEDLGQSVFRSLWQRDFVRMGVGTGIERMPGRAPHATAGRDLATASLQTPTADRPPLRPALTRRLLGRALGSGQVRLPAVPAMLDDYLSLCDRTFVALGVTFSAEQQARLREVLAGQLAAAWAASPRSEITISYESPVGLTVKYQVKAQWATVGAAYDTWVTTRQPPFFGTHPDARVWSLAAEAASTADCPVLDIGAGTGRNTLALARRGHAVDAVEMSGQFAAIFREEAAKESLPVRVLERDVFASCDDLRRDYGLILLSEVLSDFRTTEQLRAMFELAADRLAPGGRLVFNVFLARDGYEPDAAARELGQQVYTTIFTRGELTAAASGLALEPVADDSVFDYERQNLPEGAWPPTGWYANWVSGLDVFDVPREQSPIEMRWLVWRKLSASSQT